MATDIDNKFLTYKAFHAYHDRLVRELRNETYEIKKVFTDKDDLLNPKNWDVDKYGIVEYLGLRNGLSVIVGNQIWVLTNEKAFRQCFTIIGGNNDKSAEEIGWKVVGTTSEFEVNGHILKLHNIE